MSRRVDGVNRGRWFRSGGKRYESEFAPRNFCGDCGSSIWDDLGAKYFVAAGLAPPLLARLQAPRAERQVAAGSQAGRAETELL